MSHYPTPDKTQSKRRFDPSVSRYPTPEETRSKQRIDSRAATRSELFTRLSDTVHYLAIFTQSKQVPMLFAFFEKHAISLTSVNRKLDLG